MHVIISCGFETVDTTIFRRKSLSKGRKLCESSHVTDVSEEIRGDENNILRGVVLRETPGALNSKADTLYYKPSVEINEKRVVIDSLCTCKGGKGFCKHAAAVCLFINEENLQSKTDAPMVWNRPSERQLEKYKKGALLESMFPKKSGNIQLEERRFEDVANVLDNEHHMSEVSGMIQMLKAEIASREAVGKRAEVEQHRLLVLQKVVQGLYDLQLKRSSDVFPAYDSQDTSDDISKSVSLKFIPVKCPVAYEPFYFENVVVNADKWRDICIDSVGQSDTQVWYRERFVRVTASSKAHRIKTKDMEGFDKLTAQFRNEQYKGFLSKEMQYGLDMEGEARAWFEGHVNAVVQEVGLLVSLEESFLACSPDGIVSNYGTWELVEIKCPFTCRDKAIVNEHVSNVPYLVLNHEGELELKKNDKYYTQIQFSMYVVGVNVCNFVVYSRFGARFIRVVKDSEFLAYLIPKIVVFYFRHFIPLFCQH